MSIILLLIGLGFVVFAICAKINNLANELYYCVSVTCIIEFLVMVFSKKNVGRNIFVSLMIVLALLIYKFTGMIVFVGGIFVLTLLLIFLAKLYKLI